MNRKSLLVKALVAAGCVLASTASHAIIISDSSVNNFNWSFDAGVDGLLTGTGSLRVAGFGTSSLTVAITLNNTATETRDRLTSFGFGINPNATGVTFADMSDAGLVNASLSRIPSLALIEVCAFGGPNCSGGGNGGILGGASDSFQLVLAGIWGSSVNIDPIGFKYQTSGESYEFTTDRPPPPTTSVPEPGTLGLLAFGAGLIGLGRLRRRRAS